MNTLCESCAYKSNVSFLNSMASCLKRSLSRSSVFEFSFLCSVSFLSMVSDIDLRCFVYTGYGKDFVKKKKMSPDAWIQMAYQLTFYR